MKQSNVIALFWRDVELLKTCKNVKNVPISGQGDRGSVVQQVDTGSILG